MNDYFDNLTAVIIIRVSYNMLIMHSHCIDIKNYYCYYLVKFYNFVTLLTDDAVTNDIQ